MNFCRQRPYPRVSCTTVEWTAESINCQHWHSNHQVNNDLPNQQQVPYGGVVHSSCKTKMRKDRKETRSRSSTWRTCWPEARLSKTGSTSALKNYSRRRELLLCRTEDAAQWPAELRSPSVNSIITPVKTKMTLMMPHWVLMLNAGWRPSRAVCDTQTGRWMPSSAREIVVESLSGSPRSRCTQVKADLIIHDLN